MVDSSFFFSSMNSILTKHSTFSANKNLYRSYYDTQRSKKNAENENYIQKLINQSTKNLYEDKLSSASNSLTKTVSKLEDAFAIDKETDDMNYDKAYSAAEDFVKGYNDLVSNMKTSGNRTVSGKNQFISNMTQAYTRKLEKVGISANKDGTLSINKDKFNQATKSQLDSIFGKKNSFASFINDQSKQIAAYTEADVKNKANAYTQAGGITNIANISGSFFSMLG